MIEIHIPGWGELALQHLVLDYNGTLACDGALLPGVADRLRALSGSIAVRVLTADTFGTAHAQLEGLPCEVTVPPRGDQAAGKLALVERLGAARTAAVGNGRIDRPMLERSALGIAVVLAEGAAAETLAAADVVCTDINAALDLLLFPKRLVATLRS